MELDRYLHVFHVFLLLLLSTNLCTGGEFVQGTIYVNSTGVDDETCLNHGGPSHPCKTLGHVLTNMSLLNCTSCIIMIGYKHSVFNTTSVHFVSIEKLTYLEINGRMHSLLFDGAAISLSDNYGTTVVLKDVELVNCGGCYDTCINASTYLLRQFSLINVLINGSTSLLDIAAENISCHSCEFQSGGLCLHTPQSSEFNFDITDSLFHNMSGIVLDIHVHVESALGSIVISGCRFLCLQGPKSPWDASIIDISSNSYHCVLINISGNVVQFNTGTGSFISVPSLDRSFNTGSIEVYFLDNSFSNNTFENVLITTQYLRNSAVPKRAGAVDECKNVSLRIVFDHNTFNNNSGMLINLYQWNHILIERTSITENKADTRLINVQYTEEFDNCHKYINVTDLRISQNTVIALDSALFYVYLRNINRYSAVSLVMANANFTNNEGMPLALVNINLTVLGDVKLHSNRARTSGGLYIDHDTTLNISDNATLEFKNNYATYSGAIYIDMHQYDCFINEKSISSLVFDNNSAVIEPHNNIFSFRGWCSYHEGCANLADVTSLPTNMSVNPISIFPGQPIMLNMAVTVCSNQNSSCIANVRMNCVRNSSKACSDIYLQGFPTVLVHTGHIQTGLAIGHDPSSQSQINVQLQLTCQSATALSPITVTANISLLQCPFGLLWTQASQKCECQMDKTEEHVCSDSAGKACVKKGYWYGNVSGMLTVVKCLNLFCNFSKSICPPDVASNPSNYVLLSQSQDDQCLNGHGGPLCTECAEGKTATYGGLQCIPNGQCDDWHPYMLLLLNILCPFIVGLSLIIIIQLNKIGIGSGYLYGPLFYLATVNLIHIPLLNFGWLRTTIELFSATFLLKFQVLGFIPWCLSFNFLSKVDLLYSTCFELIAPLVVSAVLLLVVYVARYIPRWFKYFQKSPVHAICVLILISFWSLASTSIQIITPLVGIDGASAKVNLKPDLAYLHEVHIPIWIVAVLILTMLLIVTVALMVSPFNFVGLHRIKPILDNLQSCYKDNMRWYSGVYFCIWTVLQILVLTSNYLIFQTVIVILTVTHCLLQPYSQKWLNIMDGFLLGCLAITSISSVQDYGSPDFNDEQEVIVCISVLLPLLLIALGAASIVFVRLGICSFVKSRLNRHCRCKIKKATCKPNTGTKTTHTFTNIHLHIHDQEDREPLIRYLQESADYGATSDTAI